MNAGALAFIDCLGFKGIWGRNDPETSASQLALVVNINEPGDSDKTAVLTDLYLSLYSPTGVLLGNHQYLGADLTITQGSGLGSAGTVFTLDAAEQLAINAECPVLSQCRIGAGVQFVNGTTDGGPESVFVSFVRGGNTIQAVPEPATLALLSLALGCLTFCGGRARTKLN